MVENVQIDGTRRCSVCKEVKPSYEFHQQAYSCKPCANARSRAHHAKHKHKPEYLTKRLDSYYKRQYKLTFEERLTLIKAQDYKCAICGTTLLDRGTHTHTDHDHDTGKVRGILCTNCNRGLGHFQDNEEFLMAAIKYLQAHTVNGTQKEGRVHG